MRPTGETPRRHRPAPPRHDHLTSASPHPFPSRSPLLNGATVDVPASLAAIDALTAPSASPSDALIAAVVTGSAGAAGIGGGGGDDGGIGPIVGGIAAGVIVLFALLGWWWGRRRQPGSPPGSPADQQLPEEKVSIASLSVHLAHPNPTALPCAAATFPAPPFCPNARRREDRPDPRRPRALFSWGRRQPR